ncbi:hypothetical protein ACHAXN_007745 [Cyclotella atomus]
MASKLQEHTADEAGGESIFSSDGLPSLSLPAPPSSTSVNTTDETSDAVIVESINTLNVFENFIVKSDVEKGFWGLSKHGEETERVIDVDDPRRRLFRLKKEIDELECELMKQAAEREENVDEFTSMSNELRDRLEKMGMKDEDALAIMLRGRQEDLSRVIARDMEKFGSTDANIISEGMQAGEKGKIVYELYKSDSVTSSREILLEERLRHLEMAVGSGGVEGVSLFERVEEAMKLAKEMDAKEVDKVAAKAKVIRSDLEAAARAKTKQSNNASLTKEDSQTIASLHNQLVELEGISAFLPALASRLSELSNLHSNAAEFGSRLGAAEETLNRSEALLSNVEEALAKMEVGWKENMEAVERNVKQLDELVAMGSKK